MKKLLSVLLAVAMMASMAFAVSAADAHSLLPSDASKFETQDAGDGSVTVTAEGDGYLFSSTQGWPCAYYVGEENWLYVNENDDVYLNYDFEVKTGATNVIIYFAGQNPKDQATPGSFLCLNGVVDPSYVDPLTGDAVADLPVGHYTGSVALKDLGYRADLKDEEGNMLISGCKVFAVGGNTVVNELSIGPKASENTGSAPETVTTTKAQNSGSSNKNPNTGDTEVFALTIVVLAAAAVVTLTVVSKKAKSR